jgi:myosin heavy subunit
MLNLKSDVYLYFLLAAVTSAASLMGCSPQGLMTVLSTHKIQAGKDTITKTLTFRQVYFLL